MNNIFNSPITTNKSVVERIIDEITNAIINGSLNPGDKLPTEMELCESLQVGRNSVREAIKILEAFGVVYIKRSEGTFISSSFNKKMLDSMLYGLILQKDSSDDIVELRKVLDIGVLYAAFNKMTPEKLQNIENSFKKMVEAVEQNKDMDTLLDCDLDFHRVITESANNPLLTNVYEYITRLTIPSRKKATQRIFDTGNNKLFLTLHEKWINLFKTGTLHDIPDILKEHYVFWENENKD